MDNSTVDEFMDIANGLQVAKVFMMLRRVNPPKGHKAGTNTNRMLMNMADHTILCELARDPIVHQNPSLQTAMLAAAHLFLYAVIRQVPPTGLLLKILLARLEMYLDHLSSAMVSQSEIRALLWMLFVGMVVECLPQAAPPGNFAARLEVLCRAHQWLDGKSLIENLKRFLWVDSACVRPLEEFLTRLRSEEGLTIA
jgi:hypothetical protein